ncbi:DUF4232 domain-containing protein [Arthrobacter sp. BF1]|uniref:DUF4232 domain-containing protein n=1 Tax=Arthrobacter sp. BF1 TaxID=2821145 RepID=UPI001C4EE75D|nr:DUF4232 domain-containing protein [Arthrobacter sp. BF1]
MTTSQRTTSNRRQWGTAFALAAVIGLSGSLAACTPGAPAASPTAPDSTSSPVTSSPSASSAAPTAEETPSSTASPGSPETTETTEGTASTTPSDQATALCPAASLKGSLDDSGGGAAGHIYMKLVVTNTSGAACILDGYPGVSMEAAGSSTPIGAPADRDPAAPSNGPITLTPGQSAAATLRYTQAGNYQNCQRVQADSILVYPPSATDSLEIGHPLTACSNDDVKLLSIGAFMP